MSSTTSNTDPFAPPVYLRTSADAPLPDDPYFLMETASGLMVGRNTPLFSSLAPADSLYRTLVHQQPTLRLNIPRIPAIDFARIVGFADRVASSHGAEVIVCLFWDHQERRHRYIVPDQFSSVTIYHDGPFPFHLEYSLRLELIPQGWQPLGTIHSHVYMHSNPSHVDVSDEKHAGGCHVIIGKLDRLPALPEVHADVVIDGTRFHKPASELIEIENFSGARDDFPADWLGRVVIRRYLPRAGDYDRRPNKQQGRAWKGNGKQQTYRY